MQPGASTAKRYGRVEAEHKEGDETESRRAESNPIQRGHSVSTATEPGLFALPSRGNAAALGDRPGSVDRRARGGSRRGGRRAVPGRAVDQHPHRRRHRRHAARRGSRSAAWSAARRRRPGRERAPARAAPRAQASRARRRARAAEGEPRAGRQGQRPSRAGGDRRRSARAREQFAPVRARGIARDGAAAARSPARHAIRASARRAIGPPPRSAGSAGGDGARSVRELRRVVDRDAQSARLPSWRRATISRTPTCTPRSIAGRRRPAAR